MTCANHPEAPVAAYCRTCGKPLCLECKREAMGTIYCAEHVPAAEPSAFATPPPAPVFTPPPPIAPRVSGASPALAFILGFIPGVGAIYNGQYAKGLVHAVVFGILVSILDSHRMHGAEPFFGIMLAVWFFYMALEAYHTARKRRDGLAVEELSSIVDLRQRHGKFPMGAIFLIVAGMLLLLDQTDFLPLEKLLRFWPVGLILIGFYMLYNRLDSANARTVAEERSAR